jgi:hypothetical protein
MIQNTGLPYKVTEYNRIENKGLIIFLGMKYSSCHRI